jgi:hypothetical protein
MRRKIVFNKNEYINFVNAQNNRTNVYTTVYDFSEFSEKAKMDNSVIIDRIFLDFDAHEESLDKAWRDVKAVMDLVLYRNYQHTLFFSGRGFHLFILGEVTKSMRNVQTLFKEIKEYLVNTVGKDITLDERVGQTTRLRRVPNTVNMSSSDGKGNARFCIPLRSSDLELSIDEIINLSKKPRSIPFEIEGDVLAVFPEAPPIEAMEGEVEVPKTVGNLPMLPCLHNAIMTENPSHLTRAYLVSWYRDLLSGYQDLTTMEQKKQVHEMVVDELERVFAKSDSVWLDWDRAETLKHSRFTVYNNYNTPHCDKLISEGYCIGKCWRYHNAND